MKTVVITGSAKGLGLELAKCFRKNDFNVVISDLKLEELNKAEEILNKIKSNGNILKIECNVSNYNDLENLMNNTLKKFKTVDYWINNAGINQPNQLIWEIDKDKINNLIDVDLKGVIYGCKIAANQMIKQGYGQIYAVEGHGSNDAIIKGLSIYGTSKRAVTYFLDSLAIELESTNIKVGKLSPGIMITDFITNSMGNEKIKLDEKTKKIYNILGDYPDIIAEFLTNKMINNTKNNVKFNWLTNYKAFKRFLLSKFNKRDFFNKKTQE